MNFYELKKSKDNPYLFANEKYVWYSKPEINPS